MMILLPAALRRHLTAAAAAWAAVAWGTAAFAQESAVPSDSILALVGGTVIDGNGGTPMSDVTILIVGDRITKIGPRATTAIPRGAWQINVRGKYLTPGFVDANVHVTWTGRMSPWLANLMTVKYLQENLRRGITTLRDTHGNLNVLLTFRKVLQDGELIPGIGMRFGGLIGPRLLGAGAIFGMGEQGDSATVSASRKVAHDITRKMMFDLRDNPDSLRILTGKYLDKSGVDFIKIAVTDHDSANAIVFSQRALEAMIDEAHRRGKLVASHTQSVEGLRMAVLAGVDVLEHPENTEFSADPRLPDDVAQLVASRPVICSVTPAMKLADDPQSRQLRENLKLLIRKGCRIAVNSDGGGRPKAEFLRGVEALVEFGMTPAQALTAATRNGAIAAGAEREYGTLEVGKRADVLVLGANPLADIHNIERVELVIHNGYVIGRLLSTASPRSPVKGDSRGAGGRGALRHPQRRQRP